MVQQCNMMKYHRKLLCNIQDICDIYWENAQKTTISAEYPGKFLGDDIS